MSTFKLQRQAAAEWMFSRREKADWWRWSVLTDYNPDDQCLRLPSNDAFLIFADLVQRGLLVPVTVEGQGDVFSINPGREAEWQELIHPNWTSFLRLGATTTGYIVSGIIGAIIGVVGTKLFGQ